MPWLFQQPFDATQIEPSSMPTPPPYADYPVRIVDADGKQTKDEHGGYLELTLEILQAGEFQGRRIPYRLNLVNKNQTTVAIANAQLSALCHVVNVFRLQDAMQLANIPFIATIGPQKDNPQYSNVFGVKDAQGRDPRTKAQGAPGTAPPAPPAPSNAPPGYYGQPQPQAPWPPPSAPGNPSAPPPNAPAWGGPPAPPTAPQPPQPPQAPWPGQAQQAAPPAAPPNNWGPPAPPAAPPGYPVSSGYPAPGAPPAYAPQAPQAPPQQPWNQGQSQVPPPWNK